METAQSKSENANNNLISVFGKIAVPPQGLKSYNRKDSDGNQTEKVNIVVNVLDRVTRRPVKVHIPKRVLAQTIFDEADHAVEDRDLRSKGISFDFHQKGDILNDESECDSNGKLVNINTITIMTADDYQNAVEEFGY